MKCKKANSDFTLNSLRGSGAYETRTRYLLTASQTLYQMS